MSPIENQRLLIDQLYHLVKKSIKGDFDTATCWFKYSVSDDRSSSIRSKFSYVKAGKIKYDHLAYPDDDILDEVIPQLHASMKPHTGGDWEAFTLRINEDGSVSTKFEYPDR